MKLPGQSLINAWGRKSVWNNIDKGAELGLIGQAMWIEVEGALFGIKRDDGIAHWLEICFCCPCCCSTFKLITATNQIDIKNRFRSIGWKAFVDNETCVQCLKCIDLCPVNAISQSENQIVIDKQACLGCGFCAAKCTKSAIKLHLEQPLQGTVEDYFTNGGLKVNV